MPTLLNHRMDVWYFVDEAVISLRIFRFSATCAVEELLQLAGQVTPVTVPRVAVVTPLPRGAENKINSITE